MDMDQLTDEQHVALHQSGQSGHMEVLMDRYKNMVRAKASTMFLLGGEVQDLIQEGMIGLVKAVRDYSPDKNAGSSTFADLCVSRQMYNAIQSSGRTKNKPLNNYVSLTSGGASEDGSDTASLIEGMAGDPLLEPERLVLSQANVDEINRLVDEILTGREREVFVLNVS